MKNTDHIVQYMLENPTATVKEVSEKFMVTKKVVYNLRSYNGLSKKKPSMSVKPMVENRKEDRKSTRLNSSHSQQSRMPSSA